MLSCQRSPAPTTSVARQPTALAGRKSALRPSQQRRALPCPAASQQDCASSSVTQGPGSLLLAMASAAALLLSPLDAHAVAGGGGLSRPLNNEDLSGQDLRKIKLTKATAKSTNFTNCNLSGVSMFGVYAVGANFTGANLTAADMESGNFNEADFTNAVLAGATVYNAQFTGASIKGSDWSDVDLRKDMQIKLCAVAEGTNPVTGVDTRESLNCR